MLRALRLMATFQPFVEFASSLGTVLLIYFGGRLAWQRTLPLEDLVAFFLYLDMFYQPVRALSGAWEAFQEALAGADRVSELLRRGARRRGAARRRRSAGRARRASSRFENVSFRYDRGDTVLENIDLDIPARTVDGARGPDRRGQDDPGRA